MRSSEKPAFILGEDVRTYRELDERSTRLAHALMAMGADTSRPVAGLLPNGFEFFETGIAASRIGTRYLPVNWHLKSDEVSWILDDSGASVLVTDASLLGQVPAGVPTLVVDDDYERALASVSDDRVPLEAPVMWSPVLYTSGTTGRPKGVVHGEIDNERLKLAQQGQVALWGWTADDVYLLSGPAYHAGPGGFTMTALFVDATTVILPEWDAREWLRLVERHGVTISFMVPAHFIRILEVPEEERARHDLSSLRIIVHAGAPCPVEVKRRIMDALPCEIWELYGMSEGGATRISPQEWLERPGSVGKAWPGIEVRILDEKGRRLRPGETGLIHVTPMATGRFHYHGDEAKTAEAWRDDTFTVGDVGHLDEDGYLYITDRAADMVIRGGVNVYPREIEEVLHRHPAVVDCAVFGVPDERMGEELLAVVETREPVEPPELVAFCQEHLADFKVPRKVELVDTLPRSPAGKVLKRSLRDAYWEGRQTSV